jgi:murein DD-endopeptidase MepM/ murein hydrolase activator NlpD
LKVSLKEPSSVFKTYQGTIAEGLIPRSLRRFVGWVLAHQVDGINGNLYFSLRSLSLRSEFEPKQKTLARGKLLFLFIFSSLSLIVMSSTVIASTPKVILSGKIEQGALVLGKTAAANTVLFDDKNLTVSSKGDFVLGFSRDDSKSHQLIIRNINGEKTIKTLTPKKRRYKIQRITGIAKKIMQPDANAITRIKKDNQQISSARQTKSNLTAFARGFIAPNSGKISGVYGSQRFFNDQPKRPHFGLDFAAPKGDAVKAPAAGVVTLFVADMFYSGGTLLIDHGHGISSSFLHLSKSYVKKGDTVKKGQLIAEVGASGRATGPHLDWRINWFAVRIDPALVLKLQPIQ